MNSKTMYSRNTLPRLVLEKTEKEKRIEEMELEKEKWEEKRKRDAWLNRTGGGMREDERVKETDQEKIQRMNEETWIAEQERKEKGKKRDNHHNREELFLEEERKQHPKKRRRKERGWRKEENHSWGLEVGRREENESTAILAWLRGACDRPLLVWRSVMRSKPCIVTMWLGGIRNWPPCSCNNWLSRL